MVGDHGAMGTKLHTIRIHRTNPASGCGACLHSAGDDPVCRVSVGEACAAPELSGPPDELDRLLAALAPVLGAAQGSGRVRALHVQPGEVALTLHADFGAAVLVDQAFQTLRGLLPDTDIYVNTAS